MPDRHAFSVSLDGLFDELTGEWELDSSQAPAEASGEHHLSSPKREAVQQRVLNRLLQAFSASRRLRECVDIAEIQALLSHEIAGLPHKPLDLSSLYQALVGWGAPRDIVDVFLLDLEQKGADWGITIRLAEALAGLSGDAREKTISEFSPHAHLDNIQTALPAAAMTPPPAEENFETGNELDHLFDELSREFDLKAAMAPADFDTYAPPIAEMPAS